MLRNSQSGNGITNAVTMKMAATRLFGQVSRRSSQTRTSTGSRAKRPK